MNSKPDWFFPIIRIAGASFPVSASFLQAYAEIDSKEIKSRITKLEDPISYLHKDVPELSRIIYRKLKDQNCTVLEIDNQFYNEFSKPLAILNSKKFISASPPIGNRYPDSISVIDPSYIMYLCVREAPDEKMQALIDIVEECEIGEWINGKELNIDLPLPVIGAVFRIYEAKGYGICSNETGTYLYQGRA